MGFFNSDLMEMVEIFRTESLEFMDHMEECLMKEEKNHRLSKDGVQEIFRLVHTMKSSSAMLGLESMSTFTHRLEDLLIIYRDKPESFGTLEGSLFDLLYTYVDLIRREMDLLTREDYTPGTGTEFLERVENLIEEIKAVPAPVAEMGAVQGAIHEAGEIHNAGEIHEAGEKTDNSLTKGEAKRMNKMGMVDWEKILRLQNLTGELITLSNMMKRESAKSLGALEDLIIDNGRLLSNLEEMVNEISMMPLDGMVNQYTRVIRDISRKEGKAIRFTVSGDDIEVDKTLIDNLTTPLLHLIRNAADHGIEEAKERETLGKNPEGEIYFGVSSVGETLIFTIKDDGRGLSKEKILAKAEEKGMLTKPKADYSEEEAFQLIFQSGFSTSEKVTEFSGRGVGLDVVQRAADSLRGSVYVESVWGKGTTVTVSVPVSLTSMNSIEFSVRENILYVPVKNVEQIYHMSDAASKITTASGREYYEEGEMIPFVRLDKAYGYGEISLDRSGEREKTESYVIVLNGMKHKVAICCDEIEGQVTIVEKALPELITKGYRRSTGINGCAVTPEGGIGFILNVDWIIRAWERGDLYGKANSHSM